MSGASHTLGRLKETCVHLQGPQRSGSGYVAARGRVVTAAHCVEGWREGREYDVTVGWGSPLERETTASVLWVDSINDAALLKLHGCDDIRPLPLATSAGVGDEWHGFGFPKAAECDGLPIQGFVLDPSWGKKRDARLELLVRSETFAAGPGTPLGGFSGSPILVDGAVVGHFTRQFLDVDKEHAAYGYARACHVDAVAKLFDAAGETAPPRQRRSNATAAPREVRLPELLSWCDRSAVLERLQSHSQSVVPERGLLCIVGHVDDRMRLLMDRIATELLGSAPPVRAAAVHVERILELDSIEAIGRSAHHAMQVEAGARIATSPKYAQGSDLVALCCPVDGRRVASSDIRRMMANACQWLSNIDSGGHRFVLVLLFRFETPTLAERCLPWRWPSHLIQTVRDSFSEAKQSAPAGVALLKEPLTLGNYPSGELRTWLDTELVRESLGRTAAIIDEPVLKKWFKRGTRSHGELLQLLDEYHRRNRGEDGSIA